ncbi:lipopolysaccharide biosynthesis protein [Flaviaesturariibacter amylovorans]|uniref:Polysaccharide biosynthesis protein C-terminal domain-containing protein n=1 Tax=Flaviaesturariibacter amylovorans TaxID=1084520 RepID=A0ABP8HPT2_9BACT
MNPKQFLRGLSWLVVLNLLVKPLWVFGIDRKVQNEVGHEAYGTYFSILNLAIILAIIADAGLSNLLNRQLALQERMAVRSLLRLKAGLSALYLLVFCGICWITGVTRWDLVLLVGTLQVLSSFFVFFRNILTGYQQFRADAWLSVTDKALTLLVCAPLLYLPFGGGLSLTGFLWIQAGSTLVALLVALFLARRHHEGPAQGAGLGEVLQLSAPFVLVILLQGAHTRLDAFLLERLHPQGALEAGIYAAAYRLLDAANTLGFMTASFLVPFVARHLSDEALIDRTVLRLRHALLATGALFAGGCAAAAPFVNELLYHTSAPYPAQVLALCVAVLPAYYGIHLYGSLLSASGRLGYFAGTMGACVALNAALNAALIPRYGAAGCCVAALASQYTAALLLFAGARRRFSLRVHPLSLVACLAAGAAAFGAGWWLFR